MKTIAALGLTPITPDQWAAHVHGRENVPARSVLITFDDAYADLVEYAFPVLEKLFFPSTVFVPTSLIGGLCRCSSHSPDASLPVMNAVQIKEWSERGVTFGAHSRTHADLTTLDAAQLDHEVLGSRDDLSALTGRVVTSFAYPYGRLTPAVRDVVTDAFSTAFTTEEGTNDLQTPLSSLRRTMVQHGDSIVDVCLRTRYGKSAFQDIRKIAHSVIRPARNQS